MVSKNMTITFHQNTKNKVRLTSNNMTHHLIKTQKVRYGRHVIKLYEPIV